MSYVTALMLLPTAQLGLVLGKLAYRSVQGLFYVKQGADFDTQKLKENFVKNYSEKGKSLQNRVVPLHLKMDIPVLHQGNLHCKNRQEVEQVFKQINALISALITSLFVMYRPFQFLFSCSKKEGVASCSKAVMEDLFSFSGIPLAAFSFFIYQVSYNSIKPFLNALFLLDPSYEARVRILKELYSKTAQEISKESLEKSPELEQAAQHFSCRYREIAELVHQEAGIDLEEATRIVLPVKIACDQALLKRIPSETSF